MLQKVTASLFRSCYYKRIYLNLNKMSLCACSIENTDGFKKVYVTRPDIDPEGLNILRKKCKVSIWTEPSPVPRKTLLSSVKNVDAIFCMLTDKIDTEVIEAAGPQLKCIATMSVGYEHIDIKECQKRGIRVGFTPNVLTDATAELTVALTLATARRIFEANQEVYNGGWASWSPNWMCGRGLYESRIGLFGFGRIGQSIAKRLKAFEPALITYTSRSEHKKEAEELKAVKVEFDELLKESDIIIVCCALTNETKEIFNAKAFEKMKKTAIFINTARGGVVDQKALYNALSKKEIYAAGLDVTTPEPLPLDSPLLTLKNIVILPHIGSAETNTRREMSRVTANNILAALEGSAMFAEVPNE